MKKQALLFFALSICAFGQGVRVDIPPILNSRAVLVPNANISLCPGTATITNSTCSPASTQAFTDITLTTPCATGSPVVLPQTSVCSGVADALGNAGFWLSPGTYIYCINGPTITGKCYNLTVPAGGTAAGGINLGNGASFTPVTFSNHNQIFWAGPGATPTIDQAVTACGVNPCQVEISPLYTGPESVNLFTTSLGYKVYTGGLNVTLIDRRQNLATPAAPGNAPLYPIMFGGRLAGQITRTGTNLWCNGANDSCVANTSFAWVSGNLATPAFGSQMGSAGVAVVHGTVTNVTSAPNIVGADAEVGFDPTSVDAAFNAMLASSAQVHIDRTNAVGAVAFGIAHRAQPCTNISTSGGFFAFCFGYDAIQNTVGQANYGFHNAGNWLSDSGSLFDALGTNLNVSSISESGTTVTVTMTATCPFVAGQRVMVRNVGTTTPTVAQLNYWGVWTVVSPCGGGSTFTYTATATSLPTVNGSGVVNSIGSLFNNTGAAINLVAPSDASGWLWQSLGGSNAFRILPTTSLTSFIPHEFASRAIFDEIAAPSPSATQELCYGDSTLHTLKCSYNGGSFFQIPQVITATSSAFATATTAGTCVNNTTAVTGATTAMAVAISPVSTPGVGAVWSAFVSSAGNVTINECAVATSAGGTIAFNIRVFP